MWWIRTGRLLVENSLSEDRTGCEHEEQRAEGAGRQCQAPLSRIGYFQTDWQLLDNIGHPTLKEAQYLGQNRPLLKKLSTASCFTFKLI
jgi:hypothetical protein